MPSALLSHTLVPTGPGSVCLELRGDWTLNTAAPAVDEIVQACGPGIQNLALNGEELGDWDSRLLLFVQQLVASAQERGIAVDESGLPSGALRLLQLSRQAEHRGPESEGKPTHRSLLWRIGERVLSAWQATRSMATFTGEVVLAVFQLFSGKAAFRFRDFLYFVQNCGVESLPIVSLIAVLVGIILSFVGSVQLQMFGAEIYIANLVTLGMVMEMGALMSGVIIAGRIGAAYAAQLGTMQTNEEIDALRTMGISPITFLVLPRLLALACMMPLLCIYADVMGILGGIFIGQIMLGLSPEEFMNQAIKSIKLIHFVQGMTKSAVFGILIGFAGCLRGMECGRSAMAVGEATTSAVVTSIVFIVISDSILTICFNVLWR